MTLFELIQTVLFVILPELVLATVHLLLLYDLHVLIMNLFMCNKP
jgi:hypothetical protein